MEVRGEVKQWVSIIRYLYDMVEALSWFDTGSGVEDLVETDAQYSAEAKSKTWLDLRHLLHQKYVPLPATAFVNVTL